MIIIRFSIAEETLNVVCVLINDFGHSPVKFLIAKKAEKEVIDAAYRRLASKYHPDVNQLLDASERIKQINIAYDVLSNLARERHMMAL